MPSKHYESCIEACNECVTACELLCPAEIVDSLLHIGTHQFYKRIQPCFESPLLKGQSSALARDSGERPSLSSAARRFE
jgi:hypothetical protein